MTGGSDRHVGFKCPHCRLFIAYERSGVDGEEQEALLVSSRRVRNPIEGSWLRTHAPTSPLPRALSLAWVRVTPVQVLVAVVAASAIARTFVGWLRATPIYFPDEYIYSEVGRSIAEHGRPLVRGGSAHFPALLQPLLTAPAWLFDDVATSFRTIQLINSVVMSLGAVAVFWLARRLGLSPWVAVGPRAPSRSPSRTCSTRAGSSPTRSPSRSSSRRSPRRPPPSTARPSARSSPSSPSRASPRSRASSSSSCPSASSSRWRSSASASAGSSRRFAEQKLVLGLLALGLVPVFVAGPRSVLGYYDSVVSLDLVAPPDPALDGRGRDARSSTRRAGCSFPAR